MKIYTRTGDELTTSVVSKRVYKNDELVECLGTVDELQAHLMLCTHYVASDTKEVLENLAQSLFAFSADLLQYQKKRISNKEVLQLEHLIDEYSQKLTIQTKFLLPGTTIANAQVHISRTIARRLERRLVALALIKEVDKDLLAYLNRLSDLLYVIARSEE